MTKDQKAVVDRALLSGWAYVGRLRSINYCCRREGEKSKVLAVLRNGGTKEYYVEH